MAYPITITEFDLMENGIELSTNEKENKTFLRIVHQSFYEYIVYTSMRNVRKAVIEKYKEELSEPIKNILIDIAIAIDLDGDYISLMTGKERADNGSFQFTDLQNRLQALIPTGVWQQINALEPNIMWAGGEI